MNLLEDTLKAIVPLYLVSTPGEEVKYPTLGNYVTCCCEICNSVFFAANPCKMRLSLDVIFSGRRSVCVQTVRNGPPL